MFAMSTDPDTFFFQISDSADPEDTYITTQNLDIVMGEHFVQYKVLMSAT